MRCVLALVLVAVAYGHPAPVSHMRHFPTMDASVSKPPVATTGSLAFTATDDGAVSVAQFSNGTYGGWAPFAANPAGVTFRTTPALSPDHTELFVLGSDDNLYVAALNGAPAVFSLAGKLPKPAANATTPGAPLLQPVVAVVRQNELHVVVRVRGGDVYWATGKRNATAGQQRLSEFQLIGDEQRASSDPSVVLNEKMDRLEAFIIGTDSKLWRSHLDEGSSVWVPGWKELWHNQPGFAHQAPLAIQSATHTAFGGVLEVFAVSLDDNIYAIAQASCNKGFNDCTWDTSYHRVCEKQVLTTMPLTITLNAHEGIEIFFVDNTTRKLFHVYQDESRGPFSDVLPAVPQATATFSSGPAVTKNTVGWWQVDLRDATFNATRVISEPRTIHLSPAGTWQSGKNLSVAWDVADDEASTFDWIGVFPAAAADVGNFLDYHYINGQLDPYNHDPVPKGSMIFDSILPNGTYVLQYIASYKNKNYLPVMTAVVNIAGFNSNATEAQLVFEGMAVGLGVENFNFEKCVDDGEHTVETLKLAFQAFDERKVFEGLHLLSQALDDLRIALVACNETDIAQRMEKFLKDLISCTSDQCLEFVIDLLEELLVITYEHEHEIFKSVNSARNCFKLQPQPAYFMGGVSIGRVTEAVIAPPS